MGIGTMNRLFFFFLIFLIFVSCYDSELDEKDLVDLEVEPSNDGWVADGRTVVNLSVNIDEAVEKGEKVKLSTTSGTLAKDREPNSEDKNTLEWEHAKGDRHVNVQLKVGRSPGWITITATVGGIVERKKIFLCPSLPGELSLTTSSTVINPEIYQFGRDRTELTAKFSSSTFSLFWEVNLYQTCTRKGDRTDFDCPDPLPLRLPKSIMIAKDEGVTVTVIAEPLQPTEIIDQEEITEFYVTIHASTICMDNLEDDCQCEDNSLPETDTRILFQIKE